MISHNNPMILSSFSLSSCPVSSPFLLVQCVNHIKHIEVAGWDRIVKVSWPIDKHIGNPVSPYFSMSQDIKNIFTTGSHDCGVPSLLQGPPIDKHILAQ